MRLWVHRIWLAKNSNVLQTCGPREDRRLEDFIKRVGEEKAAYAWWLYVNSDPPAYNLEPVKHVNAYTTPRGHKFVDEHEDTASITRFPLSAFLAVSEGYEVKAMLVWEKLEKHNAASKQAVTEGKPKPTVPWDVTELANVYHDFISKPGTTVSPKWGKAVEKEPEF